MKLVFELHSRIVIVCNLRGILTKRFDCSDCHSMNWRIFMLPLFEAQKFSSQSFTYPGLSTRPALPDNKNPTDEAWGHSFCNGGKEKRGGVTPYSVPIFHPFS